MPNLHLPARRRAASLLPCLLAALLVVALPRGARAAEPLRYTIILGGNVAGSQSVETVGKDHYRVHYEFNDRGRGPKIDGTYRLDSRGVPVAVTLDGVEYMKGSVAERFGLVRGRASWQNRGEKGSAAVTQPSFYVGFDGVPSEGAWLAAAALAAPGHRLALLPAGEVTAELVTTRTLHGAGGAAVEARYVELAGLAFSPSGVWIDADGQLVAEVSSWYSVVRDGFQDEVSALLKFQDERSAARLHELAAALAHRPQGDLLIRNARVFDSRRKVARPGWSVLIRGDRILLVGPDDEVAKAASEADGSAAETIDAGGRTLLPGLMDLHTHVSEDDGLLNLANGVTSVRDLGNDIDNVTTLKSNWESGETLGPRLTLAGIIDGPGPYAGPTKMLVATEEEAKKAIDEYASRDFVQIKIYSSIDPKLVPFMTTYSHSLGLRVSGHIPAFMTAEQAVREGYDEIQHVNMLVLNFLFDQVQDTRTPARFTAIAEHAAELDTASPRVAAFFDLLAAHDTVLDPTVGVFEGLLTARPGALDPGFAPIGDRLPALVRRSALGGGLTVPEGKEELYRRSFQRLEDFVYEAWRRGIRVVAGTDGLAGFMLHRELELYVAAGIPPADVLALDTLGAARVIGRESDLGEIHPGKLADLVLVDGEPDRRISDVRNVVTVIRDGAVLDAAALDRAIGVRPRSEVE